MRDALAAAGEVDAATDSVGVWGRRRRMDDALRDGDRVECYRPLQCDPKESRRLRYRQQPRRRKPVVSGSPPR